MVRPLTIVALLALVAVPARTATPDPRTAQISAAAAVYEDTLARWNAGVTDLDTLYRWSSRWSDAAHDPHAHALRMQGLAAKVRERVGAGVSPGSDAKAMDYYLAEAAVLDSQSR